MAGAPVGTRHRVGIQLPVRTDASARTASLAPIGSPVIPGLDPTRGRPAAVGRSGGWPGHALPDSHISRIHY